MDSIINEYNLKTEDLLNFLLKNETQRYCVVYGVNIQTYKIASCINNNIITFIYENNGDYHSVTNRNIECQNWDRLKFYTSK